MKHAVLWIYRVMALAVLAVLGLDYLIVFVMQRAITRVVGWLVSVEARLVRWTHAAQEQRMDILKKHVDMLGLRVRDKVTAFEGVVTSISFDLYGCVTALVTPAAKDGEVKDSRWHDINRLVTTGTSSGGTMERAMPVPSFEHLATPEGEHLKGAADKPVR